ncbi:MAG: hypothetical protein ACLPVY_08330 [Acidimicrobiia bacterium]
MPTTLNVIEDMLRRPRTRTRDPRPRPTDPAGQWIADADERGWVVLTKDERITRRADEQAALAASQLWIFALGTQRMIGPEMAERYAANINRMVQRSRKQGPFVDTGYPDRVERRWPK